MTLKSVNPYTGRTINEYEAFSPEKVDRMLELSDVAYKQWRKSGVQEREKYMRHAAAILKRKKDEYARLIATEMGKPISEGLAEAEKCAWVCEYYAENAVVFLQPEKVEIDGMSSRVEFHSLGVVLAVMPWNFPFWQVFRFLAPAIMAGNAVVLKHASNVSGCALAIEDVMREAGFPESLFQTLLIGSEAVSRVITNPVIRAVTLTGSTPAGKIVAAKAASELKKTVLELGGSDPYVILDDSKLEETVINCVKARLVNGGQSCVAAKRFIVLERYRTRFEALMVKGMKTYRMGDPLDEAVQIGPQARHDLRDQLHDQVQRSLELGARLLLGGSIPLEDGAFYPPTVLSAVKKGMPAYDEEMFGPVAAVISVVDEEEAIHVANDSVFGLGAAIYTSDLIQAERVASRVEAGCCFINGFVRSDPRLPFGGTKESGYGRELSVYGIREFVNIKTICQIT